MQKQVQDALRIFKHYSRVKSERKAQFIEYCLLKNATSLQLEIVLLVQEDIIMAIDIVMSSEMY